MNKILTILLILIIALSTCLYFTYKQMRANHKDSIRWENNYDQAQSNIERIKLDYNEFKDLKTNEIDSLLKVIKVKPKQVETIIKIETFYTNTDTIYLDINKSTDINSFEFKESIDCLEIEGFIHTGIINDPIVALTKTIYNNEIDYIAYWSRRQWRFLGIKTRIFGKKIAKLEVINKCGDLKVKQIDIIKKK